MIVQILLHLVRQQQLEQVLIVPILFWVEFRNLYALLQLTNLQIHHLVRFHRALFLEVLQRRLRLRVDIW